jgi:hypothetical protein
MNSEFTLKNVVEFLEAQGFYVREAREIEEDRTDNPFEVKRKPERKVEAIRVEIAPNT